MLYPSTIAISILSYIVASSAVTAFPFVSRRWNAVNHLTATQAKENDNIFWPSTSSITESKSNGYYTDDGDDDNNTIDLALDSVVKVYCTHSEPDFLIPWQKKHQTTSTSSGFVLNCPGIGYRVMTELTYRQHLSDVSKVTYPIITSELFQNTLPVM